MVSLEQYCKTPTLRVCDVKYANKLFSQKTRLDWMSASQIRKSYKDIFILKNISRITLTVVTDLFVKDFSLNIYL